MKPIIGQAGILGDLKGFDVYRRFRVAEKTSAHGLVGLRDESRDGLRAKIDAFDQVVPSIKHQMFENAFDDRPHTVGCFEIVLIGVDAKRGRAHVKAHFQSI
jgi:hypothetical protein